MNANEVFSIIMIAGYIIYYFVLLVLLYAKYDVFLRLKLKENPKYAEKIGIITLGKGGWAAGTFYFRPPFPIYDNSKNLKTQNAIISHNKLIKVFWYSSLGLIPVIYILNIINK